MPAYWITCGAVTKDDQHFSVSSYHKFFLANVSDAWNVLRNWADAKIDYVAQSGSTALICGIAVWVVTGLILLGLMALDCASIQQIRNRCKRNKRVVGAFITAWYKTINSFSIFIVTKKIWKNITKIKIKT